jgi:hypothetical protein
MGGQHGAPRFDRGSPFPEAGVHSFNRASMLDELWSLQGRSKTLHLTWVAFSLTFVLFNLAPLATTVKADMDLSVAQIRAIAICNVALTVPSSIIIVMLLDTFGPTLHPFRPAGVSGDFLQPFLSSPS